MSARLDDQGQPADVPDPVPPRALAQAYAWIFRRAWPDPPAEVLAGKRAEGTDQFTASFAIKVPEAERKRPLGQSYARPDHRQARLAGLARAADQQLK